jgi:1-acyl-sn-glycerol-3-phosphate acyltransferase
VRRFLKNSVVEPAVYWWAHYQLRMILVTVARWKVIGREHVPRTGAFIVVSNHLSIADPPVLASAIPKRRIRYMAKIEIFKPPFGFIPRAYGAFAVRRFDADLAAMLNAERLLRRGHVLGMFPEGTRSRSGQIQRPHPGTAAIALISGAPILPCAIIGTDELRNPWRILKRPRINVVIGEPIRLDGPVKRPTEAQVSELTDRIFEEIQKLLPPKYHAAYTGSEEPVTTNGANSPSQ